METHSPALVVAPVARCLRPSQKKMIKHDIFLSHSGKQKGFAKDLEARLASLGYTVFFDQNYDSLPLGEAFPPHIFSAANSCKLAIVALSEDFLTSPWPLMELCSFGDRLCSKSPSFTILPLFLMLSPGDMKTEENVKKWRKEWERFERKNSRVNAQKCEEMVTKVLPSLNGLVWSPELKQGESSYIDDIIKRIFSILLPINLYRLRYGADPNKQYVGVERMCQVILDKFRELEDLHSSSEGNLAKPCILGMHGVSGSGKSTLCNFLCNSMFDEFMGKVIHLELPTELRGDDDPHIKEQYAKILSTISPYTKETLTSMDLVQLYNLLLEIGTRFSLKMLLVFDNISTSNYESYEKMVNAILWSAVLASGSRVMLVAQSHVILDNLLIVHTIIEVPCLTKEEAMEVIRHTCYSSVKEFEDVIPRLLDKCSFPSSSFMYVPFVFEQIGILMRKKCHDGVKEVDLLWKLVDEGKKDAIKKLVETNFMRLPDDLRVLLFDIALFIIPAGYSKLSDATPILCRMHDMTDTDAIKMEWKIKDLMEHCALSVTDLGNLRVHDLYVEFARSIPGNPKSYVDEPSVNFSNTRATNSKNCEPTMFLRMQYGKYSEARTVYIGSFVGSAHRHIGVRALNPEIRLHLEIGATTRALLVRNSHYLKCILGLSGDLSSLVCLQTENVQQVALSPSGCDIDVNLSKLLRLELKNESIAHDVGARTCRGQKRKRMSYFFDLIGNQFQHTTQSMMRLLKPLLPYEQWPAGNDHFVGNFLLSGRMSQLRVLILINAGIRRLENIGGYCPQLEVLEVVDDAQYAMDVCVDNAPNLQRLVVRGENHLSWRAASSIFYECSRKLNRRNRRRLALQLGECRQLQHIYVDRSFDQVTIVGMLPSSLRHLHVANDRFLQFMPTKLISSSIHQLSLLATLKLTCKVETLNFTRQRLGCLPSLRELSLQWCESLTRVSMEPGCMPNLVSLKVSSCDKLLVIEGVQHILWMEQMEKLSLWYLPQLQVECDLWKGSSCEASSTSSRRLHFETITVTGCPRVKINGDVLMMQASESIWMMCLHEVSICRWQSQYLPQSGKCSNADESETALLASSRAVPVDRLTFMEGRFTRLWNLDLHRVSHLREIEGIQHLPHLAYLKLSDLPHLARVSGIWQTSIQFLKRYHFGDFCCIFYDISVDKSILLSIKATAANI